MAPTQNKLLLQKVYVQTELLSIIVESGKLMREKALAKLCCTLRPQSPKPRGSNRT